MIARLFFLNQDHPNHRIITNQTPSMSSNQVVNNNFALFMISSIKGSGGHSRWISISNVSGLEKKEVTSATYGDLDLANLLVLTNEMTDSNVTAGTVAERRLAFFGKAYRELELYSNGGEFVQNRIETGAIRKNSTFMGTFINQIYADEVGGFNTQIQQV